MPLSISYSSSADTSVIELAGELDASTAGELHEVIEKASARGLGTVEIRMAKVGYMASAGLRSLVFARQKMGEGVEIRVVGANEAVARVIRAAGLDRSVQLIDE
ncbi:anti-sigma B factor antagonist [Streptacidiphilus sp. MAP12-20]|uniref:STAS domain-containing protein n=1 Tax=Streptacidiphilus sp. MAP12-20 TaxID=3156299 RepID=UPI00351440C6